MGEAITLKGEFDYYQTYDSMIQWRETFPNEADEIMLHGIHDIKGGLSAHIPSLEYANIEIFQNGTVIIDTGNFIDPALLISMVENRLRSGTGGLVKLRYVKHELLPRTRSKIAEGEVQKKLGLKPLRRYDDSAKIVALEALRIRRIYDQDRHPTAGERAPGEENYNAEISELGITEGLLDEGLRLVKMHPFLLKQLHKGCAKGYRLSTHFASQFRAMVVREKQLNENGK